jgi:hypothetical protein
MLIEIQFRAIRNTIRHILVFFVRFSQNQLLSFCVAKS